MPAATDLVEGPLVIADISGYTAFLADSELEHAREILSELLDHVVASLDIHLTVAQLEGDAVCFVGTGDAPDLIGWIEAAYLAFHRRLRDITIGTTCPCRACSSVHSLTIKFVAHRGTYGWHRVGRVEQLVGTPVNAVHRLLKNTVPSHEYVFASGAILDPLAAEVRAGFIAHAERYEHVGEIRGGYRDLAGLRAAAEAPERGPVSADEARASAEALLDAPPEAAWWLLADPQARRAWMGVERIDLRPGARGTLTGAEFHCNHGPGAITVFRVISANEPHSLTQLANVDGVLIATTFVLEPAEAAGAARAGRTRIVGRTTWDLPPDDPRNAALQAFIQGASDQWIAGMRQVIANRHAAGAGSGAPA